MKKLRLTIGSILAIFAMFVSDDVFALKCNYNFSGYDSDEIIWEVDSTKNKPADIVGDFGYMNKAGTEPIINWDTAVGGYKAKTSIDANKCPEYLIHSYSDFALGDHKVYLADTSHRATVLKTSEVQGSSNGRAVFVFKLANRKKDNKTAVKCTYVDPSDDNYNFTLEYDSQGNLIDSENLENNKWTMGFSISYTAYETKLNSNTCNINAYICWEFTSGYRRIFLNADGLLNEDDSMEYNGAINSTYCTIYEFSPDKSENEEGETPSTEAACKVVDEYINSLKTYAQQYKECKKNDNCVNGGSMNEFTRTEEMLQTFCNSVYKVSTYSDSCSQACVAVDTKIAQIKSANGMGVGDGGSDSCSLSQRLTNWIFKIVKWVRYLVPILLIMLSIMDFIKAVASDSEDEMRKVGSKFVKRLIVAAIIFILPLILEFLLGIFGIATNNYCL